MKKAEEARNLKASKRKKACHVLYCEKLAKTKKYIEKITEKLALSLPLCG